MFGQINFFFFFCLTSCRIQCDSQTTGLILTTGVGDSFTKRRGVSNMNIHYDVSGLLSGRSHSGRLVWVVWVGQGGGGGGSYTHMRDIKESVGSRQLDVMFDKVRYIVGFWLVEMAAQICAVLIDIYYI